MPRVLQRVHLPAQVQGWDAKLKLRKWVNHKSWDTGPRYAVINQARNSWDAMGYPDFADDPQILVGSVYEYLVKDQGLVARVVEGLTQFVTDEEEWNQIAKAYAWVILQRYNRELGGEE